VELIPADPLVVLAPVANALEQLGVRYHVGGSLASSAHGLPRASADVDLVAELRNEHVDAFVHSLEADYYLAREQILEAIGQRAAFNLIHLSTMMKVDIFVPGSHPFEEQEMSRARPEALDPAPSARTFFVKSAEDVVLRKLSWYRAGREVSERQWSDVIGVLKVKADQLDADYLVRWAAELEVDDLLYRALAEAEDG